ncbi:MAG TPA: hypothetical protein VKY92_00320 [Verrucomicrobiae bacterium]|nr:hypothetical protein [Verrucomicrobiae bacterium]
MAYGAPVIVIGLLRFLGLVNAAVWFGASFFFIFIGEPASSSGSMQALLGPKSFPYFSAAISQLLGTRFFGLFLVCAVVAMLHVGAEWLYFGKYPRRVWLLLIFGLFLGGLIQSYGLQPKLQDRLAVQFSSNNRPEQRESARHSFRLWHAMSTCLDVVLLSGIGIYLWRVANPPDEMRFVGASNLKGNFRG